MAARSTQFAVLFGPTAANTTQTVYTVPAGRRAILRHVQLRSLAACTTLIGITGPAGGPYSLVGRVDAAAVPGADMPMWIVYNAGDGITWRCTVANNLVGQFNGVLLDA